ncbi:BlaI/MecI/CopY family transcriptional regulator [Roseivirga sp. E12]|uniref:BlaI/MecI/CopY family transcriptional regulator n=1 Tax=Roseivirga sp. E12 TaxID=2819237 RepID=UPI001ABCF178|nr:BlaI/MecI/CopY family transcriptional regulator [Roseivirga sp. E12]MBO3700044.1 BlaI/MecI/CopY family transcriptional regulator [Roseivirga sp. E12]
MKELTKAEEQIMQVVWEHDQLFIKDIVDHMPDPKPAYNTVGTFLKILEAKGFVTRVKIGNTYAYSASVKKKAYTQSFMNGFLSNYFEGSAEKLFSFMVEEKKLNLKQVEDLMKKLKDND